MSKTIIRNLKSLMHQRGMNARELALRSEVNPSFIYDILSGKSNNPSSVKLQRVAKTLQVELHQILEQRSEKEPENALIPREDAIFSQAVPMLYPPHHAPRETVQAPPLVLNKGWLCRHHRHDPAALRLFEIEDDAMQPGLSPRDLVMVDTQHTKPSPPGLFLIFDQFQMLVRRVELVSDDTSTRLHISCDNSKYNSYERGLTNLDIIGRVIWMSKWV